MRHLPRAVLFAAITGFVLGLIEFGFVFEGLLLSIEDIYHLSTNTRIAGFVLVAIASFAFAIYAARSAIRTQLQALSPTVSSES